MDFLPQFGDNVDQSGVTDPSLAQINLKRKLALADSLRNTPIPEGQMVSGRYVAPSWTQYLAGAMSKAMAGSQERQAMKEYGDLQKARQTKMAEILSNPDINATIQGMTELDPNFGVKIAETRVAKALTPKEPNINKIDVDKFTPESVSKFVQSGNYKDLVFNPNSKPITPYFQAIPTEQGYARFNARTGNMESIPVNGKIGVLPAAQSPALQGEIAGAKTGSEAQAKREFNMSGASDTVDQAEKILTGKVKPTASGIGALTDYAGSVVGYAPKGAAEADQLKALGGQLVAKMPRMEGPQSDRDVQLYTQMAGQIGDPTIPVSRRLAALQTVRGIVQKYEPQNKAQANTEQKTTRSKADILKQYGL